MRLGLWFAFCGFRTVTLSLGGLYPCRVMTWWDNVKVEIREKNMSFIILILTYRFGRCSGAVSDSSQAVRWDGSYAVHKTNDTGWWLPAGSGKAGRTGVDRNQWPADIRRRLVRVLGGDAQRADRRAGERQRQLGPSHRQRYESQSLRSPFHSDKNFFCRACCRN